MNLARTRRLVNKKVSASISRRKLKCKLEVSLRILLILHQCKRETNFPSNRCKKTLILNRILTRNLERKETSWRTIQVWEFNKFPSRRTTNAVILVNLITKVFHKMKSSNSRYMIYKSNYVLCKVNLIRYRLNKLKKLIRLVKIRRLKISLIILQRKRQRFSSIAKFSLTIQ